MKSSLKVDRRTCVKALCAVLAGVMLPLAAVHAGEIDSLKSKGKMVFGIVTDQNPFGFINGNGSNDGYDIELARDMAKKLGVTAEFVPVTAANRIPLLLTGKVDALICVLGMYPDRAKVVQYTEPYAVISASIYGKKDDKISTVNDLAGQSIAVARASSMDKAISQVAPKTATIRRYDDDSSAIQALLSGQTQVLSGYSHYFPVLNKAAPNQYEQKVILSQEFLGIAVRPSDKDLAVWINAYLDTSDKDGSWNSLYKKWFGVDKPSLPKSLPNIPVASN
ncbi:transporter substrate-binding domain-containing protein [Paraburkholderia sp. HD33-4]|uniref:transporter substrate-binding domain-containing protein n=1 Tax=Paraburkholderia sp. HD33-4 TaxID=2883242 RepID=UPI001F43F992|nr:transporter substrate-binding domain-containing protein [Paraburkholderia sp. HD33-4]